jgi:hypothetical protein
MNEPEFKSTAWLIAEKTPEHLGKPTIPPIHWVLDGENLRVLLADGRTVRAPIADQNKVVPVKKQAKSPDIMGADPIIALPVHPPVKKGKRTK